MMKRTKFYEEFVVEVALAGATPGSNFGPSSKPTRLSALKDHLHEAPKHERFFNVYMSSDVPTYDYPVLISGWSAQHAGIADDDIVLCKYVGKGFAPQPGQVVITQAKNIETPNGVNEEWKCVRVVERVRPNGKITVSSSVRSGEIYEHELDPTAVIGLGVYKFPSQQIEQ